MQYCDASRRPIQRLMPATAWPAAAPHPRLRSPADWLWLAFLVWTAIGFVVLPLDIGERQARGWFGHGMLLRGAIAFLQQSDAIWILLAASNVYLHAAAAEGLPTARRWAAIILVASAVFEWIGVDTGVPFGTYRYTDHFGWRLGGVLPAAIPLAWLVILLCGRYLVLALRPQATRLELALGVAAIALLTDLNLEFVAWKVRGYWIWYPGHGPGTPAWPPWQNYASWFLLSFLLTLLLPANCELRPRRPAPTRPIFILGAMNLLFGCAQVLYWTRPKFRL
jgi:hypothetical protein